MRLLLDHEIDYVSGGVTFWELIGAVPNSAGQFTRSREVGYDSGDYCTFSPDNIFGVNISAACSAHDIDYASNMNRADADAKFKANLYEQLVNGGVAPLTAIAVSTVYYQAVRAAGSGFYTGSGSNN